MALEDLFSGIAGAIRQKDGTSETIVANDFPSRILAIPAFEASGTLEAISIDNPPLKTVYQAGEIFDPTYMVVSAHFSDGSSVIVGNDALVFSPSGPLTTSVTQINMSFSAGGATKTAAQPVSVLAAQVFGVAWDSSNPSTEMTRLTEANDPNGFVNVDITTEPVPAVGAGDGSSPFDNYLPWSGMEEYNIVDGEVKYKYGNASFSRTAYDTVVYIPEFWYNVVTDGTKRYYYVSNQELEGFEKHPGSGKYVGRYETGAGYASKSGLAPLVEITRANARMGSTGKGTNWCQFDFSSWCAIEFLFRIEFASWDSQSKVGRGYVDGNSAALNTGQTDSMLYHTGRAAGTDGKTAVQYRRIENPWGNIFKWVDGINFDGRTAYICLDRTKYADDTAQNYTNSNVTLPQNGYIKNLGNSGAFQWAFLPSESGGSETTYIPDYVYGNTEWRVLYAGGGWYDGSLAGLWCFFANYPSSNARVNVGARLLYNP